MAKIQQPKRSIQKHIKQKNSGEKKRKKKKKRQQIVTMSMFSEFHYFNKHLTRRYKVEDASISWFQIVCLAELVPPTSERALSRTRAELHLP